MCRTTRGHIKIASECVYIYIYPTFDIFDKIKNVEWHDLKMGVGVGGIKVIRDKTFSDFVKCD